MTSPGTFNFTLYQGATLRQAFTWKLNGSIVDLTNYTARSQFKALITDTVPLLDLTTANGGVLIDGPSGTFTLVITSTQSAAIVAPTLVYDVDLVAPSGDVTRIMSGTVTVSPAVTNLSYVPSP
jgi:hypothetical protein